MNRLVPFLLMTLAVTAAGADLPARRALQMGEKAHRDQDFAQAADLFSQAARQASAAHLDPAVAHFNHGHALYRAGKFDEAFAAFTLARQTTDLALQSRALFNAGTCRLRQVDLALEMKQAEYIEAYLAEAQTLYEQALLLAPQDTDSKINLEMVQARRRALEFGFAQLRQVLDKVDAEIGRYAFEQAYGLLQKSQPALAPILSLPRPEAKKFQTLLQRCQQVLGILHPEPEPAAPPPAPGGPV